MINKLRSTEAAEFSPESGAVGAGQSRLRWAVNGLMSGAVETGAITGNVIGRSIHGIGKSTWHFARGLFNKPL